MPLPSRADVIATFSSKESKRLKALTLGENIAYYGTAALFLASPFFPLPHQLVANSNSLHPFFNKAPYIAGGATVVLQTIASRLRNKDGMLFKALDKTSKVALALAVAEPIVMQPHGATEGLAAFTALGLFGGLINSAPTDGAAGQEAMFKIRDFFAKPLTPSQSFFEGLKVGAWRCNVVKQAGTGILVLVIGAQPGISKLFKRNQAKVTARDQKTAASTSSATTVESTSARTNPSGPSLSSVGTDPS